MARCQIPFNEIPIWNDGTVLESSSEAVEDESATSYRGWERADRKIADDIVDGVIHFHRHPPDAEELERLDIMMTIWADLQAFCPELFDERSLFLFVYLSPITSFLNVTNSKRLIS
jgi:hypothetical protein